MFDFATESGLYRVKSPLNYVGGKFDLLEQFLKSNGRPALIPENIETFVDVFCGGFNVGANVKANKIIGIDLNEDVVNLLSWMKNLKTEENIADIQKIISFYELGRPKKIKESEVQLSFNQENNQNIYAEANNLELRYRIVRSMYNQERRNKNAYVNFISISPLVEYIFNWNDENKNRDSLLEIGYNIKELDISLKKIKDIRIANEIDINQPLNGREIDLIVRVAYTTAKKTDILFNIQAMLYTIIAHGFNSHIRFGPNGYNIPYGHRTFNDSMERNFAEFSDRLKNQKAEIYNSTFEKTETLPLTPQDYVYFDPPYLITTAPYNESGKGWGNEDDQKLYGMIDKLNERGIRFGLSNVIEHNGETNEILAEWSKKYILHDLNYHYNSASYNLKITKEERSKKPTREVFITNVR